MAAAPVNPGPGAGAASAAGPTAVPSSPAPAAPASPAPAAPAPASTPAPEGVLGKIADAWSKMPAVAEEPAAEPATEEPAAEPVVPEPADVAEEPATEPATEEKPAEAVPVPELVIDELDGGPKEFMAEVAKDPAAKAFFDAHPEWRNTVNAALRRNADAKKIAEVGIFPQNAPLIAKAAATFQQIDNKFLSVANEDGSFNPDGAKEFLNTWVRGAMYIGEDGKPEMTPDGKYKLHPALTHTLNHIYNNGRQHQLQLLQQSGKLEGPMLEDFHAVLQVLGKTAETSGDERLQQAVAILSEVNPLDSAASGELPPELKPKAEALKAKETALNEREQAAARQQQESRQTAFKTSLDTADSRAAENFQAQVKPLFEKAGLSAFESKGAIKAIGDQLDATLEANGIYMAERQSLERQLKADPSNAKLQGALTQLTLMHGNELLPGIVARVIREAKGGALGRQASKDAKIATQTAASAADPRGTSITPSAPQVLSPRDLGAQIVKEYMDAHGGERPSTEYIIAERMKRSQSAKRTA